MCFIACPILKIKLFCSDFGLLTETVSDGRVQNPTEPTYIKKELSEIKRNSPKSNGTLRNQTELSEIRRNYTKSNETVRNQMNRPTPTQPLKVRRNLPRRMGDNHHYLLFICLLVCLRPFVMWNEPKKPWNTSTVLNKDNYSGF